MPTIGLPNHIRFFYEDSGAPHGIQDYTSFVIIHGHTFHSALFKPLLSRAQTHSCRVIAINRREYPGSSPYTQEELKIFTQGTDQQRSELLLNGGSNLALLVDGLIQTLSFPASGGVAVVGWSLGNLYMLSMLASVDRLPADTRERLGIFVKRAIMWDPPAQILGIRSPEGTYIPLEDENLSPEARLVEFRKWVTYYFVHGDLSARDPMQLNYKTPDPDRKPTFEHLPIQELLSLVDLAPGQKCDTVVCEPAFADVEWGIVNKALFDRDVRATWSSMTMWHIFGDACPWNVYLAAWRLEDEAKKSDLAVNFTMTRGANHFPMWDNPEGALSELSKLV